LLLSPDAVPEGFYPRLPSNSACSLESDGR
jgi:hypothetical protein